MSDPSPPLLDAPEPADDLETAFTVALRQVATTGQGSALRAGQVRVRLAEALGPGRAERLRPRLHRAVVAAEEQVPATLASLAPLTEPTVLRVAADLAGRRGWTLDAARQATTDWAVALALTTSATSTPQPDPAPDPWGQPGPVPAHAPAPVPRLEPAPTAAAGWPAVRPGTRRLLRRTGLDAPAAAHAYAGLPLALFWGLLALLLVLAVIGALVLPSSLPGRANGLVSAASIGAALLLSSRLRRGLLLAGPDGLTFVPFDRRMLAPQGAPLAVTWSGVEVESVGRGSRTAVGTVRLDGRRIQVGPEGSALLRALVGGPR